MLVIVGLFLACVIDLPDIWSHHKYVHVHVSLLTINTVSALCIHLCVYNTCTGTCISIPDTRSGYRVLKFLALKFPCRCTLKFNKKYCIPLNYRIYPYERMVKQFHSLHITASVGIVYFKGICCGYPFELHWHAYTSSNKLFADFFFFKYVYP